MAALATVVLKVRREGAEAALLGLDQASETVVARLVRHDKPGAPDRLMGL